MPLTIQNLINPPANEDAENFVFGKQISFVADFSGTAISNPDSTNPLESTFSVSLYNASGSSLFAQSYTVTPSGTIVSTATPEPGELWLVCAGLLLLAGVRLKGVPLYTRGK